MKADLKSMGFQAVMHDWNRKYVAGSKKEKLNLV
jgi:hypothetical protein